jgi:hypothetical protein
MIENQFFLLLLYENGGGAEKCEIIAAVCGVVFQLFACIECMWRVACGVLAWHAAWWCGGVVMV